MTAQYTFERALMTPFGPEMGRFGSWLAGLETVKPEWKETQNGLK